METEWRILRWTTDGKNSPDIHNYRTNKGLAETTFKAMKKVDRTRRLFLQRIEVETLKTYNRYR